MPYASHPDDEIRFFVRRIDQRYRVAATGDGLEHTHHHGFTRKKAAYRFLDSVRAAYRGGRDLNLVHWNTEALD